MALVDAANHVHSGSDSPLSPEACPHGFVADNHASSNENEPSSQLLFPRDGLCTQREHPLITQNGSDHYTNGYSVEQNGQNCPPPASPIQPDGSVNGSRPTTSDAQLAEAFVRGETQTEDVESRPRNSQSIPKNDPSHNQHDRASPNTIAVVAPTRKRNFSNRTKTGCLTCRRRKKKCDETHPICITCTRGGFPCAGYSVTKRGLWPASAPPVKPLELSQSKDGHSDVSECSSAYKGPSEGSPGAKRTSAQYEGGQMMPIPVNDNDTQHQQKYAANFPQNDRRNRPPYPNQQPWTPQQDTTQHTPQHLPPPSEVNRSVEPPRHLPGNMSWPPTQGARPPPQDPPSHLPPGPPISHHRHVPPSPPQYQYAPLPSQPDYRSPCLPPTGHHTSTTHVRMTSSGYDPHKSGLKTFNKEDVERSRMLRGTTYNHFDTTLVNERQRCERALQRYNDASKLGSGVSEMEVRNILLRVFDPTEDTTHKFLAAPQEKGTLGDGVRIEAPFTCTYGYNIKTMDNVYIGKNSTIDDAGKVDIGPHTWIGSNVTILTTDVAKDVQDRKGSEGAWFAKGVTIASEVVIGANTVIYPGVTLGRGSTVEPFAVVRENLPAFQTQYAPVGTRVWLVQ